VNTLLTMHVCVAEQVKGKVLGPGIILTTLPGHHSTHNQYGGYCYVNHSAVAARLLRKHFAKVAVSLREQHPPLDSA
jgi:acetoin utilization deacetylase AcuC-like enzyme